MRSVPPPRGQRLLVLTQESDAPGGVLLEAARQAEVTVDDLLVSVDQLPNLAGYGAIVVLGGEANVDEEDRFPWLAGEKVLVREVLAREIPLLGVCLGAQLMAEAAGAAVYRMPRPEIGWITAQLTPEAAADPLFAAVGGAFDAFSWHSRAFTIPAGATPLASSAAGPQAFRLGRAAWGVQFHPEVTAEIVTRWLDASRCSPTQEVEGIDLLGLQSETERRISRSTAFAQHLFARFLTLNSGLRAGV